MSSAVVKVSERLVGIAVLRSISLVITPPLVSIPRERGVTSISRTSLRSPFRTPACSAAPIATTSSGLTPLLGSRPVSSLTSSATAGIRVEPPTRMTSEISEMDTPASLITSSTGFLVRSSRSRVSSSNFARVSFSSRWMGPSGVTDRYCREMLVLEALDSSFLACSAASCRRCRAILSLDRSAPVFAFTCASSHSTMR